MKHIKTFEKFNIADTYVLDKHIDKDEYDVDDFNNIIEILERDCGKFMKELKLTKSKPLLRGSKNVTDYDHGIWYMITDKDRKPRDTSNHVSKTLDKYFLEKLGVKLRSSGVFATKKPSIAYDYGKPYLFFPKNDYKYYWNTSIDDLYTFIENEDWYYTSDDDMYNVWDRTFNESGILSSDGSWVYNGLELSNDLEDSIEEVRYEYPELKGKSSSYIKDLLIWKPEVSFEEFKRDKYNEMENAISNIVDGYKEGDLGIITSQEMTFICDDYYLVDISLYDNIVEYLSK